MNQFTDRGALTVDQFCAWAAIGRNKFYQEVNAGRLKLRKIGRKSVVTMQDAQDWLNALPEANGQNVAADNAATGNYMEAS